MTGERDEHRGYEEFAVRHVMGGLDERESQVFRSHLLECEHCRQRVGELRSIASELAEVERAERRERAARAVETKQREDADDGSDLTDRASPRSSRIMVLVGLGLIMLLSVWNFLLRGENAELSTSLAAEREASAVINFGDPWDTVSEEPGVNGRVRVEGRRIAVMVAGTDDDSPYTITQVDGNGAPLRVDGDPVSRDGYLRYLRDLHPRAVVIEVTKPTGRGSSEIVLRARLPSVTPTEASSGTDT